MENRGFTIVEVMITLIVISILLGLGVVGLRGAQGQARDGERRSDIEVIARGLETRYSRGNSIASGSTWLNAGQYPGGAEFYHALGYPKGEFSPSTINGGYMTSLIEGASQAALSPPTNNNGLDAICSSPSGWGGDECGGTIASKLASKMSGDKYLYAPFDNNGNTCYGGCVGFNLYWRNDAGVIQGPVKSKHR